MQLNNFIYIKNSLIYIFIIILPINLFSSGSPQIHHYVVALTFIFTFIFYQDFKKIIFENLFIVLFFIYSIFLNSLLLIYNFEFSFIKGILYNSFNLFVFLNFLLFLKINKNSIFHIRNAIIISTIFQFFILIMFLIVHYSYYDNRYDIDHLDLLAKSKNTLGFILVFYSYAIYVFYFNRKNLIIDYILKYFLLLIVSIILFYNSSLSSLGSFIILVIISVIIDIYKILKDKKSFVVYFFLILGMIFIIISFLFGNDLIIELKTLYSRLHNDWLIFLLKDFFSRGYLIGYHIDINLFFGNGDLENTGDNYKNMVIHSLPIYIFYSYGIIGTGLILIYTIKSFSNNKLLMSIFFVSFLPYILTHNTMINTLFWICFALTCFHNKKYN